MDVEKELKRIEEHFENLTTDELEEKLIKAGIERIKPAKEDGYELL